MLAGCFRLGDVIPPPGVNRTPYCRAHARRSVAGDELATRALLQLLVPGLLRASRRGGVRLAASLIPMAR